MHSWNSVSLLLRIWWPSGKWGRDDGGARPTFCCILHEPSKYLSLNCGFWIFLPYRKNTASYNCRICIFYCLGCEFSTKSCVFVLGFTDDESQIQQVDIIQTGAHSKMSTEVSNTPCGKVSSAQIPTVCFDLGNEWDDFDDENLLHASDASVTLCPADVKLQHSEEKKKPGRETWVHSLPQIGHILFMPLCFLIYCRCHLCSTSNSLSLTSQILWNHQ